jgi:hypothetical protein
LGTNVLLIAPFIQLFDSYPIPTPSPISTYSFIPTLISLNYLLNETSCDLFFGGKISLFCEMFFEENVEKHVFGMQIGMCFSSQKLPIFKLKIGKEKHGTHLLLLQEEKRSI